MDEKDILLKTIEGLKRYFHLDSCVWICMRVKRLQRKSLIKKKKGFRRRNPISVIGLAFEPYSIYLSVNQLHVRSSLMVSLWYQNVRKL